MNLLGQKREAEQHKADPSSALHFAVREIVHRLSSNVWKVTEKVYISVTGGRGSASSVETCDMLAAKMGRPISNQPDEVHALCTKTQVRGEKNNNVLHLMT